MDEDWDLGDVESLPVGKPALRRGPGGERLACVRRAASEGGGIDVVDDRCPHEGYPLSQGEVRDGVLTCAWHNWKFDLGTGACTFGGEAVRRYDARVDEAGHLRISAQVGVAQECERIVASLREGLFKAEIGRCTRESLRLAARSPAGVAAPFETLIGDGLARERYGLDHPEASTIDVYTWVTRGWIPAEPALTLAAVLIGEPLQFTPERSRAVPVATLPEERPEISAALISEQREQAEGRVRAVAAVDPEAALRDGLLPFLRRGLYDYGHGAIFAGKALEIARSFPALGESALASMTVSLGWATTETSLPPWTATRRALADCATLTAVGDAPLEGAVRAAYETEVLFGEREAAVATVEALRVGHDPVDLLTAIAHAAAERLRRFDIAWTRRLDAGVGFLDVTHAVTCARAMRELWALAPNVDNVGLVVLAAAFVGRLRKADAEARPATAAPVASGDVAALVAAVRRRDPSAAGDQAGRLLRNDRLQAYPALAPFAAFEAAVLPIRMAHTVKVTEALYRLDRDDPEADAVYLQALTHYLASALPERNFVRTATIAGRFLADGRPPPGLY